MDAYEKLVSMSEEELNEHIGPFNKKDCVTFIMGTLKEMAVTMNNLVKKEDKLEEIHENLRKLNQKAEKLDQLDAIQSTINNIETKVESHAEILNKHETEIDKIKGLEERVA